MGRRVLFFGAFDLDAGYPRARSLMRGLESQGVEVFQLRESILPVRGERLATMTRPWRWPGAALRLWNGSRRLRRDLRAMIAEHEFDAVIVPYPGWFSVRDARRVFDGPVVLDLFLSLSDTAVADRRLFRNNGVVHRVLRAADRRACLAADRVLLDTPEHADYLAAATGVGHDRFDFVPIGDPDAPAVASAPPVLAAGEPLRALYLGTGVPLHGVSTILEACAAVDPLVLTFVGGTEADRAQARALGTGKVSMVVPWVDTATAHELFDLHHVVLGIFGTSDKAMRVVPFKVVHALAHGRLAITADTPAMETMLNPGDDCLTVPAGRPDSLAHALRCVLEGPRLVERIGARARFRYEQTFSETAIGRRLVLALEDVTGSAWGAVDAQAPATLCATSP